MGTVEVVNKRHLCGTSPNDFYIGRGSPLGNPWPISATDSRDQVIDRYATWIEAQIHAHNPKIINELQRIADHVLSLKPTRLVCFCAPRRCHGDVIKKIVCDAIDAA